MKTWSEETSISNQQPELRTKTSDCPVDGVENLPHPVVCWGQPWYAFCKYSISDICSLIIFKSDQDTTAAEAIHKEAHILFLLLFFFVGMELVSTKPTKPTCSYVLNKRLFIFFFCCFCLLQVCMMVCRTKKEKRERENKNTINEEGERDKERMESKSEERKEIKVMIQAAWFWIVGFHCRVCCCCCVCVIVTVESFCALPPFFFDSFLTAFFVVVVFSCLFLIGSKQKDPRQSLGHTSMFVGTRSADWL